MKSQYCKVIFPSNFPDIWYIKGHTLKFWYYKVIFPSNSRHLVLKRARFEILMLQGYIPLNFQSFGAKKGMLWNLSTMRSYSLRFSVIWDKKGHALKSQRYKVIFPSIYRHLGQKRARFQISILQGHIPSNSRHLVLKKACFEILILQCHIP